MFEKLRNLLARPTGPILPAVPPGQRLYAIGDIHGCLDLYQDLIARIEDDDAARGPAETTVVLLGDLIDRGPDSAGVIARTREWSRHRRIEVVMGNHEEMLLASRLDGEAMRGFARYGGLETIHSYGVDPAATMTADIAELQSLMNAAIPQDDIDFIAAGRQMVHIGDYLFVHAGVRPEVPIADQHELDCRWIREPFLSHRGSFGACVIHGHSIAEEPDVRANRIGIDTGAYMTGTLTAVGLEGTERWFLQSGASAPAAG